MFECTGVSPSLGVQAITIRVVIRIELDGTGSHFIMRVMKREVDDSKGLDNDKGFTLGRCSEIRNYQFKLL